jgi:hypothetical protein
MLHRLLTTCRHGATLRYVTESEPERATYRRGPPPQSPNTDTVALAEAPATLIVSEVAAICNVSPWLVRKWIRAGSLATLDVPGAYRITPEALASFLGGR